VCAAVALTLLAVACAVPRPGGVAQHRWWAGLGPVLPHESFPANCDLCHVGREWDALVDDFSFDHLAETGVPLEGAHTQARCLRCHNDRGPVALFDAQGCRGCHEDVHHGELGAVCTICHQQETWQALGMVQKHNRTRFPLVAAHASAACWRCHPGSATGRYTPTSVECVTCHADDLARTTNHVGLGWVDRCDRCHMPTFWQQAEAD
jgi:hypothetical protein